MNISEKNRALTISTFVFYIVILLWITILKCNLEAAVQGARDFLEPMSIGERFAYATSYFRWRDGSSRAMLLNVLIFVPFGILVPLLKSRTAPVFTVLAGIATTVAIESLQLILTFGYFTYSDIIFNSAGAALGMAVYAIFIRKMGEDHRKNALIFSNILAISVSVYAIINTVLNINIYM